MKNDFDVIVIGGGAAGISAAKTAKGLGKKTAIVERKKMGGECTWNGCVPRSGTEYQTCLESTVAHGSAPVIAGFPSRYG